MSYHLNFSSFISGLISFIAIGAMLFVVALPCEPSFAQNKINATGSGGRYHWDSKAYLDNEETIAALAWYENVDEDKVSASALAKKMMLVQWGKIPLELVYNLLAETVVERGIDVDDVKEMYQILDNFDWQTVNARYSYYIYSSYSEDKVIDLYEDAIKNNGKKHSQIHKKLYSKLDKILREVMVEISRRAPK